MSKKRIYLVAITAIVESGEGSNMKYERLMDVKCINVASKEAADTYGYDSIKLATKDIKGGHIQVMSMSLNQKLFAKKLPNLGESEDDDNLKLVAITAITVRISDNNPEYGLYLNVYYAHDMNEAMKWAGNDMLDKYPLQDGWVDHYGFPLIFEKSLLQSYEEENAMVIKDSFEINAPTVLQ